MKKSKKGKTRATKPKARARKQPVVRSRQSTAAPASAADLYSGGFDFTSPAAPEVQTDALNQARAQLQMGKPDQALAFARQALSGNPQDPAALNVAGVAAFQAGQQDEGKGERVPGIRQRIDETLDRFHDFSGLEDRLC